MIFLSFALIKEKDYQNARAKINELLVQIYEKNSFLKTSGLLGEKELEYYNRISSNMNDSDATLALHQMSDFLSRYYGKKVIILLDEYDTPLQEAFLNGYWDYQYIREEVCEANFQWLGVSRDYVFRYE